jgi:hypothetical protein
MRERAGAIARTGRRCQNSVVTRFVRAGRGLPAVSFTAEWRENEAGGELASFAARGQDHGLGVLGLVVNGAVPQMKDIPGA